MSATTEQPTGATAIRSFHVDVPEETVDDLRRRLAATRWPQKELVEDSSQGVQLSTTEALVRYWERVYPNLISFNEVDKGGHFAAWEEPELFAGEMRAAFRALR